MKLLKKLITLMSFCIFVSYQSNENNKDKKSKEKVQKLEDNRLIQLHRAKKLQEQINRMVEELEEIKKISSEEKEDDQEDEKSQDQTNIETLDISDGESIEENNPNLNENIGQDQENSAKNPEDIKIYKEEEIKFRSIELIDSKAIEEIKQTMENIFSDIDLLENRQESSVFGITSLESAHISAQTTEIDEIPNNPNTLIDENTKTPDKQEEIRGSLSASHQDFIKRLDEFRSNKKKKDGKKLRIGIISVQHGGHDTTANSIKQTLEEESIESEIIYPFKPWFVDSYYKSLAYKNGIFVIKIIYGFLKFLDQYFNISIVYEKDEPKKIFKTFLKDNFLDIVEKYDLLISTSPYIQNLLATESIIKQRRIPIISIPTDIDEFARGVYIQSRNILYLPYTDEQLETIEKRKCPHFKRLSGLPLRKEFRDIRKISKAEAKQKIGFDPDKPVIMVSFGSSGNEEICEIARLLEDKQCILICAKNEEAKEKLDKLGNQKHIVKGFVDAAEMAQLMRAADVNIGKAGGITIWESMHCETISLLLEDFIYPIEEPNVSFLTKRNLGKIVRNPEELLKVIDQVLANPSYNDALAKMENNAAKEAVEAIKDVLNNYEQWQDRLWGKRRILFVKLGSGGGHHETVQAIKRELKEREWTKNWDLEESDQATPFGYFLLKLIMQVSPSLLDLPNKIRSAFLKIGIDTENIFRKEMDFDDNIKLIVLCCQQSANAIKAIKQNKTKTPIISIVTDFSEYKENNWLHGDESLYLLGTNYLLDQAKEKGLPNVIPTSGMVIRKEFKQMRNMPKSEAKQKLGFSPDEPVICVTFGFECSGKVEKLAEMLKDRNIIFICGNHREIKEKLESFRNKKHRIIGFANAQEMATCLRASEIVIGKPGNITISEAWESECVPICQGGDIVMVQEKCCEQDIKNNKRGIIVDELEDIPSAIETILSDPTYAQNCSAVENNALYQACEVIENIVNNYEDWQERLWECTEETKAKPNPAFEQLCSSDEEFRKVLDEIKSFKRGKSEKKPKIAILTRHMIGGHYITAKAIEAEIKEHLKDNIEVEIIDSTDQNPNQFYNEISTRWGTFFQKIKQLLAKFEREFAALYHLRFFLIKNGLTNLIDLDLMEIKKAHEKYDLVICTSPFIRDMLLIEEGFKQKRIPIIVIPTDAEDFSDGIYIHSPNVLYLPYTERHLQSIQKKRCPHFKQISGLPLRKEFKDIRQISKAEAKEKIGFKSDEPVIMVSFGSSGNEEICEIASLFKDKQCILMCAKNEEIKQKLDKLSNQKHIVKGFVDAAEMAQLMRAADINIGKPGFCLVSEAIQCETIYVSLEGLTTLQEETSERFLETKKLGAKAKMEDLPKVVDQVLADPSYKDTLAKMENNAAREATEAIKDVLANYEKWQNKLWGKKKLIMLRQGTKGGFYESINAIEKELRKREWTKDWKIQNLDIESYHSSWICEKFMQYAPWIVNSPLLNAILHYVIFFQLDGDRYPKEADIIILCAPKNNRIINHLKKTANKIPLLTVVSDFGDISNRPLLHWLNEPNSLYLLGTNYLLDQAKEKGLPHVIPTSGMVIRKEFKDIRSVSKSEAKEKIGFKTNEPVICVCYGSAGNHKIKQLAEMLKNRNTIFICGNYKEMKEELENLGNEKHKILGYVDAENMATCLRASEVVIGKPGPGVVSEAWECECVPICQGGDVVMTQEKIVEQDIKNNKRGIIIDKLEDIPAAIETILSDPTYVQNCSAVENKALEQVCEVIEEVVDNYEGWQDKLWNNELKEDKSS